MVARNIAEYTAFGAATTPIAPTTATAPSTQNSTASAVEVWAALIGGERQVDVDRHRASSVMGLMLPR